MTLALVLTAFAAFVLGYAAGKAGSGRSTSTTVWREMPKLGDLPAGAREAIAAGRTIEAIRLIRRHAKVDLKTAKQSLEGYRRELAPGE